MNRRSLPAVRGDAVHGTQFGISGSMEQKTGLRVAGP